jgi:hypothetical protein
MPKFIFLSGAAAGTLCQLQVSGLEVIPLEALEVQPSGFSPGRLHHWLDPERARSLGEEADIA